MPLLRPTCHHPFLSKFLIHRPIFLHLLLLHPAPLSCPVKLSFLQSVTSFFLESLSHLSLPSCITLLFIPHICPLLLLPLSPLSCVPFLPCCSFFPSGIYLVPFLLLPMSPPSFFPSFFLLCTLLLHLCPLLLASLSISSFLHLCLFLFGPLSSPSSTSIS